MLHSRLFRVAFTEDGADHHYAVDGGEPRGPFPDRATLDADLQGCLARWRARAARLGGHLVRVSLTAWIVTLPEASPIQGGEPVEVRVAPRLLARAA